MAEVEFRDITSEGLLRQSSFKGLSKGTRRN
jgi:bifunctional non-homologous end joining protein LigD